VTFHGLRRELDALGGFPALVVARQLERVELRDHDHGL